MIILFVIMVLAMIPTFLTLDCADSCVASLNQVSETTLHFVLLAWAGFSALVVLTRVS